MKKIILAVALLSASFVASAAPFVAAQSTSTGEVAVTAKGQFAYTDPDGKFFTCTDVTPSVDVDNSNRPYVAIGAVCGNNFIIMKQYKDDRGGSLLIRQDVQRKKKAVVMEAIITKGEGI